VSTAASDAVTGLAYVEVAHVALLQLIVVVGAVPST
jgi:hypothetical protein